MKGGHENNLKQVAQDHEAVRKVAALADDLGLLIHVEGIPFGYSHASDCAIHNEPAYLRGACTCR